MKTQMSDLWKQCLKDDEELSIQVISEQLGSQRIWDLYSQPTDQILLEQFAMD